MSKTPRFQFLKLEREKEEILNFLDTFSKEDLEQVKSNSWSLIQAMRHIREAENGSLAYMKKKIQAGDDLPEETLKARFMLQILYLVFFLGIKFKAPQVIASPKNGDLEELKKDWASTRNNLEAFLHEYPNKWQNKALYRHPLVGRLHLRHAIEFFVAHQRHHRKQLHRIAKQLKKP